MVPKLLLLFTTNGWSAQPYSINFGSTAPRWRILIWHLLSKASFWELHNWSFQRYCFKLFCLEISRSGSRSWSGTGSSSAASEQSLKATPSSSSCRRTSSTSSSTLFRNFEILSWNMFRCYAIFLLTSSFAFALNVYFKILGHQGCVLWNMTDLLPITNSVKYTLEFSW